MKLIVHIGTEKTGTTAIQNFLSLNNTLFESHGFYIFKSPSRDDFRELPAYCMRDERYDDFHRNNFIKDLKSKHTYNQNFKSRVESEILNLPKHIHTVVVSSEHLHSRLIYQDEVDSVKDFFIDYFQSFEVIVYLREQLSMAVSRFSTMLKSGGNEFYEVDSFVNKFAREDKHYFNFDKVLTLWEKSFGIENIRVRLFDKKLLYKQDVVQDFIHTLSPNNFEQTKLNFIEAKSENESINIFGQDVLFLLNQTTPSFIDSIGFNPMSVKIERFVSKYSNIGKGKSVTKKTCLTIASRFKVSNEKVRKKYFPDRDQLFELKYEKYNQKVEKTPQYQLDVIEELIKLSVKSVSDVEINSIRDAAIALEKVDMNQARKLMNIAYRLRPDGPLIKSKVDEYKL